MHGSTLTPDEERELASLRARAYGPTADISADPRAIGRLRELEAHRLDEFAPAASPPPADIPATPSADIRTATPSADDETQHQDVEPSPPASHQSPWRRLRRVPTLAWVIVVAAAIVVVAIVWGVAQITASRPDFTLAEGDSDEAPPTILGDNYFTLYGITTEGMQIHEVYRTVTPWSWTGPDGTRCLLLTVDGFDRIIDGACTPRGLDPIAHVTTWPGLSAELVDDLPQGSVIRFELQGDRVNVWVRAASERS